MYVIVFSAIAFTPNVV